LAGGGFMRLSLLRLLPGLFRLPQKLILPPEFLVLEKLQFVIVPAFDGMRGLPLRVLFLHRPRRHHAQRQAGMVQEQAPLFLFNSLILPLAEILGAFVVLGEDSCRSCS
jgi:hypothetical protein